jgi:hypothetical protein
MSNKGRLLLLFGAVLSVPAATAGAAAPTAERGAGLPGAEVSAQIRADGLPVLLERLATQTGIRLSAVQHLKERRVTVLLERRPLREVMVSLADLWSVPRYPAKWLKHGSDQFELWQDARAVRSLEDQMEADRERIAASLARLVDIAGQDGAETRSPETDPVLRRALYPPNWTNGGRSQAQLLGSLAQAAQQAVVHGESVWTSFGDLPPGVQRSVAGTIGGFTGTDSQQARAALTGSKVGLQLRIDPDSPGHQWHMFLQTQSQNGRAGLEFGFPLAPLGVGEQETAEEPPSDPRALTADQLDQLKKGRWEELADFELDLGRVLRESVVSDYFHDKPAPRPEALAGAASVGELLERAVRPSGYRWRRGEHGFELNNPAAAFDLQADVPWTLEQRLTAEQGKLGYVRLPQLADAAQLNDKQLQRLSRVLEGIDGVAQFRALLTWYRSLDASRRLRAGKRPGLLVAISGPRAIRALMREDGKVDPLVSSVGNLQRMSLWFREEIVGDEVRLLIDARAARGPWVQHRFVQKRAPAVSPVDPMSTSKPGS